MSAGFYLTSSGTPRSLPLMSPQPIQQNASHLDLSARFQQTTTVAASPSANAETTIATLTLSDFGDLQVVSGIQLSGWAAFTVGTSGTAVTLKLRETSVSGTTVATTGALTATAANLDAFTVEGFDATPGVGVYVLTMTVTGGAATSTVSAVSLRAVIV